MGSEKPIACTLTAQELPERLAEMRAIGNAYLQSARTGESEAVLRFRAGADARERLAAIVAAESRCCAFLDFDLEHAAAEVVLRIRAPDGGEPVMHQLVEAFSAER